MRLAVSAAFSLLAAVTLCPIPASAQWVKYPTPGVPRMPDGKPNLAAPAPRTGEGKPDLSGLWDMEHNLPCPAEGCLPNQPSKDFNDIGSSVKGGLPYQPWAADAVKQAHANNRAMDPLSHCLPTGIVRSLTFPEYRKIIQVPRLLVMLNALNASYRQIFTDGRPMPTDPDPSWNGYSTGKWDGDTLVVQTTGFRDGLWLDNYASPLTAAAKIIERFRRVSFGKLEVEITVDDPKAYTRPWTGILRQTIILDTDLLDYICLENEKDVQHFVTK
jgi:hypothetical protein